MSPRIGFSTGALAYSDFRTGLRMLVERNVPVVELSALRDRELQPLVESLDSLPLSGFSYISFHAPSSLTHLREIDVGTLLRSLIPRRWPIIVHPDIISDFSLWSSLGSLLCIENMDKRKPIGRTVAELEPVFQKLPEATFCFDIGHARQIDPTMSEASRLLKQFANRLQEVHMSEVGSNSKHEGMSFTAVSAFQKVSHLIPASVPIVLESVIPEEKIEQEIRLALSALHKAASAA